MGAPCAPALLSVAERFVSVNGEGTRAGQLSAFIRLAGCNLGCDYCDTPWARSEDAAAEVLSAAELAAWAASTPAACVTVTGGEPLVQPGLPALVEALLALPPKGPGAARFVEVETNGACDVAPLDALRDDGATLALTLDCKLGCAGAAEAACMVEANYELLRPQDAVKFVCADEADLAEALAVIGRQGLPGRCHVLLSPVHGRLNPAAVVAFMEANGMAYARLQLQLHKLVWPDRERGV